MLRKEEAISTHEPTKAPGYVGLVREGKHRGAEEQFSQPVGVGERVGLPF